MRHKTAFVALLIILGLVNWEIFTKEKHLAEGKVVYLPLLPVDPRSLMQGDYMALRFQLSNAVYAALPKRKQGVWQHPVKANDGYVLVSLDAQKVASFKAIYKQQELGKHDMLMRYRVRQGAVKFATNAFFFQEGHAHVYQAARYGQFRVDEQGELLLVGMYDKDFHHLSADKEVKK